MKSRISPEVRKRAHVERMLARAEKRSRQALRRSRNGARVPRSWTGHRWPKRRHGSGTKNIHRREERPDFRLGYNVAQRWPMPANVVVRARIDAQVKEDAAAIYAAAGLTLSDAFRMLLMRTVAERALPFDPLTPNEETVEAMKAARRGDLVKVGSIENLLTDLHADD